MRRHTVSDRLTECWGLSENLVAAISKATHLNPRYRFAAASEFEAAIRKLRTRESVRLSTKQEAAASVADEMPVMPTESTPSQNPHRPFPFKYIGVGVALVLIVVILFRLFSTDTWSKAPIYRSTVSGLSLRSDTGTMSGVIQELYFGAEMRVVNIPEIYPWVKVRLSSGQQGYVYSPMLADQYDFDILNRVLSDDRKKRHISLSYRRRSIIEYFKDPNIWNTDSTLKWELISFYYRGEDRYAHDKSRRGFSYFRIRLRNNITYENRDVVFVHQNKGGDTWEEIQHFSYETSNSYTEYNIESLLSQYNLN